MKNFFLLLFLLFGLVNISESQENGTRIIIIQNLANSKLTKILENSNLSVWTTSGKHISGRVSLIKADTIFFKDTSVRVSDINQLYFKSIMPPPNHQLDDRRRLIYDSKGSNNILICPPDSVYRDDWAWENYLYDLVNKVKEKKIQTIQPYIYKNFLKVNIAKLGHLELALSYERFINKSFSWETELSAIFGANIHGYTLINYPLFNYSGFSITTYPKFYYTSRAYIAIVMMYRNLWFTSEKFAWPDVEDHVTLQDQFRNDFGLSLRFGWMFRYRRFVIDYYFGGGVKLVMLHQNIYGKFDSYDDKVIWNYPDHSADRSDTDRAGLVLNLGIKIGGAF